MLESSRRFRFPAAAFALAAALVATLSLRAAQTPSQPPRIIVSWERWPDSDAATTATAAPDAAAPGWLRLTAKKENAGALVLRAPGGVWDLGAFAEIAVPLRNPGPAPVAVMLEIRDTASLDGPVKAHPRTYRARAALPGDGSTVWLAVPLGTKNPGPLAARFLSMQAAPADFARHGFMDGAGIAQVSLRFTSAAAGAAIAVGPVQARGVPEPWRDWPESRVFPLVDEFGQYAHRSWPGKINSADDFAARREAEDANLAAHARPQDWNCYGGWAGGPQRRATGFFRVEKIDGQWWMIDPDGRLFWSHGVVRVATRQRVGGVYRGTPLPDREHLFRLPPKDSPLGRFYDTEAPSTRGYYFGKGTHAVYDFLEANLFRKYGGDWTTEFEDRAMRRLDSWGLNTIANSSDPAVYLRRKTPYTAIVYSAPMGGTEFRVEASDGNWGKLPDPFDPAWRRHMDHVLRTELKDSLNDPWCLGFFVDNELKWGDTCHTAEVVLASPPTQPAKRAFVEILRKKYDGIVALNAAWGTAHTDWDALLAATTTPDRGIPAAKADLEMLSDRFIDEYFSGCRAALKATSPHHLYLGARFSHPTWFVTRIAARHCDVISENIYAPTLDVFRLAPGVDLPVLIGEFHFGAPDRGLFDPSLVPVADQAARATAYREYVASALRHPSIVGTHWFQFYDQPTTGRFDGENFQTGLVDICDTPYAETIAAVRATAASLYQTRVAAAEKQKPIK